MRSSRSNKPATLLRLLLACAPVALAASGQPAEAVAGEPPERVAAVESEVAPSEAVPTRWRHLGRVIQVDAAERIVVILADPLPGTVPQEVFTRDAALRPTARLLVLPMRRAGVFAALSRGGLPEVGEEVVFDVK